MGVFKILAIYTNVCYYCSRNQTFTLIEVFLNSNDEVIYNLEYIKFLIDDSPRAMQAEFVRSGSAWINLLRTRISTISLSIYSGIIQEKIDEDIGGKIIESIHKINEHLKMFEKLYSKDKSSPPAEVVDEFMQRLNRLLDK
jgi:tRNA 2-selenouridine synthase SelU